MTQASPANGSAAAPSTTSVVDGAVAHPAPDTRQDTNQTNGRRAGHQGTGHAIGSATALATKGLTKRFRGGQVAVDDLDLTVPAGSVFGFLGPNGSGKTTTIRMLLGLVGPTRGTWSLLGVDMPGGDLGVLRRVGALIEGPAFHPYLNGTANLHRLDAADRLADPRTAKRRVGQALERVGLSAAAGKRYRNYSLGMRQRLGLAAALLQPRDLLVLDEPTNGLDPQGTREVRTLVRELAADGITVFLSSHLLGEIEQLCSHAGIMAAGKLVAQGSLAELGAASEPRLRVETRDPDLAVKILDDLGLRGAARAGDGAAEAILGGVEPERANAALVTAGVPVRGLAVRRQSLEDTYFKLTGEGFDVNE